MNKSKLFALFFIFSTCLFSACIKWNPQNSREVPTNAQERAKKNVEEGRGVSVGSILGNKTTNYEFSSSNPMWRASLEVLNFMPLTTVDYSGGLIITDWYNDDYKKNESIKITVQFLSNEVRSDSLKITIHKKNCNNIDSNCKVNIFNSKIKEQLTTEIIRKAATLEKQVKKK